jgi:hypothetical protein
MGSFRDRFFTPRTARAILSWRILLGIGVGAAVGVAGLPIAAAIGIGAAVYAVSVATAMPERQVRASIDPFALSEPWRQFVQAAQRSRRQLRDNVGRVTSGPLHDRLDDIAGRLDRGIEESWSIARRGDEIDDIVRGLDPTRLRSRLTTLRQQAGATPTESSAAAIASVESQLASADRLKALSASTADRLRLTQSRFDELVARAAEIAAGAGDAGAYAHDVDDLVLELEALHLAMRELPGEPGSSGTTATS